MRSLTGAVVSVWGKASRRQIMTPTLTSGIRGTEVYTEMFSKQGGRTYFCNCHGVVELAALAPARAIKHTDEALEFLTRLVGERTTWQVSGREGSKILEREYGC